MRSRLSTSSCRATQHRSFAAAVRPGRSPSGRHHRGHSLGHHRSGTPSNHPCVADVSSRARPSPATRSSPAPTHVAVSPVWSIRTLDRNPFRNLVACLPKLAGASVVSTVLQARSAPPAHRRFHPDGPPTSAFLTPSWDFCAASAVVFQTATAHGIFRIRAARFGVATQPLEALASASPLQARASLSGTAASVQPPSQGVSPRTWFGLPRFDNGLLIGPGVVAYTPLSPFSAGHSRQPRLRNQPVSPTSGPQRSVARCAAQSSRLGLPSSFSWTV